MNCVVYHDNNGKKGRDMMRLYEWYKPSGPSGAAAKKMVPKIDVLVTTYEIAMQVQFLKWSETHSTFLPTS